jgi:hypothetical protein
MRCSEVAFQLRFYRCELSESRRHFLQDPSGQEVVYEKAKAAPFAYRSRELKVEEEEIECGLRDIAVQRGQRVAESSYVCSYKLVCCVYTAIEVDDFVEVAIV